MVRFNIVHSISWWKSSVFRMHDRTDASLRIKGESKLTFKWDDYNLGFPINCLRTISIYNKSLYIILLCKMSHVPMDRLVNSAGPWKPRCYCSWVWLSVSWVHYWPMEIKYKLCKNKSEFVALSYHMWKCLIQNDLS